MTLKALLFDMDGTLFDTEGLCFILLVGDAAQIPYFTNGGGAAAPGADGCDFSSLLRF